MVRHSKCECEATEARRGMRAQGFLEFGIFSPISSLPPPCSAHTRDDVEARKIRQIRILFFRILPSIRIWSQPHPSSLELLQPVPARRRSFI